MKVTVKPPYQVCHDGTVYGPGERADVPDDVAAFWARSGWVDTKPEPSRKKVTAKKPPAERRAAAVPNHLALWTVREG